MTSSARASSVGGTSSPSSPSLDRIYQLGLWSAIFFAIFLRLPPNKFFRIPPVAKEHKAPVTVVTVTELWSAFDMARRAREGSRNPLEQYEAEATAWAKRVLDKAGIPGLTHKSR
jgi:hypothetical protein